ncbi:hypothetical protein GYB22_04455 [bacterium]|nr:hypothetical protein [bacterium]
MKYLELFNHLDKWKEFPNYQLERRADIFFAIHLKEVFRELWQIELEDPIPEFPVQKNSLPAHEKWNIQPLIRPNQSFQIDYLAFSQFPTPKVFLIEFKTDMGSRNERQDWYLQKAKEIGLKKLLSGLKEVYEATDKKSKRKYDNLLEVLIDFKWINRNGNSFNVNDIECPVEVIYLQPTNPNNQESTITFYDVKWALSKSKDEFTERFIASLNYWK